MYQNAIRTIRTLLPPSGSISQNQVIDAVDNILKIPVYSELDKTSLIRTIEELYRIRQDDYLIIEKNERRNPWLNEKRSQINFENGFWGRYRDYLGDEKNFAPDTINKIDRLTDNLIEKAINYTKGDKIGAAKILGISKSTLYERIRNKK